MELDIKKVLKSFCATSNDAPEWLKKPWLDDQTKIEGIEGPFITATNKQVLIVVPKSKLENIKVDECGRGNDFTKTFAKKITCMAVDINLIDSLLNENELKFETVPLEEKCECCNGRGEVRCDECTNWHNCGCCDGDGVVASGNSGQTYAVMQKVQYRDGYLNIHYLKKIKDAMDCFGGKWQEGRSPESGFYYFKNDAGVHVVICPIKTR